MGGARFKLTIQKVKLMSNPWTRDEIATLKEELSHVLWIGGATDAGKTTLATHLGDKYGLQVYHGDKQGERHWSLISSDEQPAMYDWGKRSHDERWVEPSVEQLTQQTLQIMEERIPFIIDDLRGMPSDIGIIVDWFGLLPKYIVPLQSHKQQALWLFPNEDFKQYSIQKRDKPNSHHNTSNPEKAWKNHLKRDLQLALYVKEQAQGLDANILVNDGQSVEDMLSKAEAIFEPFMLTQ